MDNPLLNYGIITFHKANNYGAVLQTYALQQILKKQPDVQVEVIDYYCSAIEDRTRLFYTGEQGNIIKKVLRVLYYLPSRFKIIRGFRRFRESRICTSDARYTPENIAAIKDRYDAVFTGSDQVWNYDSTGLDRNYFLEFCGDKTLKCSYAASFGFREVVDKYHNEIVGFLKNFDFISMRENIGTDCFENHIGNYEISVDPTLLLDISEWKKLSVQPKIDSEYILIYNVLEPKRLLEYVDQLSEQLHLPVYAIGSNRYLRKYNQLKNLSVEEYLGWIENASYIATTSFHGTVFSVLNKKRFVTEFDTRDKYNHRVKHLLDLLHISNREVENPACDITAPVNWDEVDNILAEERNKADWYFKQIKTAAESRTDE